ncbi:MAG TPA: TonB-dependent receptor, partial [Longimicrobium sp.]|nr:TonB-dependent receptor [Longimicrobium sp.]
MMNHRHATLAALVLTAWAAAAGPARGQRAGENPVTAAEDAFGSSVGGESIGVYGPDDVRGFSPLAAGNVRLEGLYFDRRAEFTSRLVAGHAVRVGMSAGGASFPAPTGIVEYRLRKPGDARVVSVVSQANSYGGAQVETDVQLPLAAGVLGVGGGVGLYRNRYPDGGDALVSSLAFVPRWRPAKGVEVLPFWSRIDVVDRSAAPVVLVAGDHLPPEVARRRFFGQPWADADITRTNAGVLAGAPLLGWALRGGVFRSAESPHRTFSIQFRDATREGMADRVALATGAERFASTSGEVRLSRAFGEGRLAQAVHFSLRGRDLHRRYGGSDHAELGPGRIAERRFAPAPEFRFAPQTRDHVRQWTGGVSYQARWGGLGELGLGVQRAEYRKAVTAPGGALPVSRDALLLYSGAVTVHPGRGTAVYAGFTQGLEESPVAPEVAVNRGDAPPPIRTEQADAGFRWSVTRGIRLTTGAFRVEKPYYALDSGRAFRPLGRVRHQGVEVSVSGEVAPGLRVVAGAVPIDAEVSGEQVRAGVVGARPVGISAWNVVANVDYQPPAHPAVSWDVAVTSSGSRAANAANTLTAPGVTLLDA